MFSIFCHIQSITEYYRVLQGITEYNRVLQSITEYYRVLQSITEYNRVLQSITQTKLAHLLGQIFLLVYTGKICFRPHVGRSFYNIMSYLHTFLIKKANIWRNTPNLITTRPLFQEFSEGNRSSINSPYIALHRYSRRLLVH